MREEEASDILVRGGESSCLMIPHFRWLYWTGEHPWSLEKAKRSRLASTFLLGAGISCHFMREEIENDEK